MPNGYRSVMGGHRHHHRTAALGFGAFVFFGVAYAPISLADDGECSLADLIACAEQNAALPPGAPDPVGNGPQIPDPQAGWTQPGDLVLPATGGPPIIAGGPAAPGMPVLPATGGPLVVPG